MPRDILRDYGPDSASNQKPSAAGGGAQKPRDVMNYSPPKGPSNIGDAKSPGLHGDNYGCTGTQGPKSTPAREGGSPGIHGDNKGHGTNR